MVKKRRSKKRAAVLHHLHSRLVAPPVVEPKAKPRARPKSGGAPAATSAPPAAPTPPAPPATPPPPEDPTPKTVPETNDSKTKKGTTRSETSKVRRHNNWLSLILILGGLLLLIWYMARRTVCWGNYGYLERHVGITLCNIHVGTVVALLASLFFAVMMIVEVSNLEYASNAGRSYRRARSLWSGYRSLGGWDFFHFHFGTLGFIGLGWLLIWIIFFSPIRF